MNTQHEECSNYQYFVIGDRQQKGKTIVTSQFV